jgi:hypothetical protein
MTEDAVPTNIVGAGMGATAGNIAGFDPVLISLVRRAMPNLMAYDVCGVQPMTGPTGLIFAIKSRYATQTGDEAFFAEADTDKSTVPSATDVPGGEHQGTTPSAAADSPSDNSYNYAAGMSTAQAEALGTTGNVAFGEMAFSIDKVTVTAKTRALKAD